MIDLAAMLPPIDRPAIVADLPADQAEPFDDSLLATSLPAARCGPGRCFFDVDVDFYGTWPWAEIVLRWGSQI